jgi:hypothetical protein
MKRWVPSRLAICMSAWLFACTWSSRSVHRLSAKNCFHAVRPGTMPLMPSIRRMAGLALSKLPYMSSVKRPTGIASYACSSFSWASRRFSVSMRICSATASAASRLDASAAVTLLITFSTWCRPSAADTTSASDAT